MSETATLTDGSGSTGLPHVAVNFTVISGPDAGTSGTAVTNASGQATFSYTGAGEGEDVVRASVTTVGSFISNSTEVMWTDDASAAWSSADIGGATPAGGQVLDPLTGGWTIQGGGDDVAGTADQFHYLWQTLPADGGIGARISSETGTSTTAQSGVMLRVSTDPASPYYAAIVAPGGGITVQDRATLGGASTALTTLSGALPAYLWVGHSGSTFTTYGSSDGYDWAPIPGSTVTLTGLPATLLAGLAVASDDAASLTTATMSGVVVSATPPAPQPPVACPAPWTCADIGSPAPAGSQSFDPGSGTWTITGGGADVTGTSDQFRYVWQTMTGDGSVSAQVATQTNTSSSAKAGIMLRASTDPAAPNYTVFVTPGTGIKVQVRSVQGGTTSKIANPAGTVPQYLEVTRTGSTFSAYTSPDGVTWTLIPGSTATVSLPASVLAGLAVTSHNTANTSTVTMNSVTVPATGPTPSPTTPTPTPSPTTPTPTPTPTTPTPTPTPTTPTPTPTPTTPTPTPTPTPTVCPVPWTCADIGSPAPAGSQSFDLGSGTWTITGGGADVTGTSDQFRYVWQTMTGDGSVSAQVATQTNTSSSAKAGIMLRASTDPAAANYTVFVTPGTGIKVQVRKVQGGTTSKIANPAGTVPQYLEVTRTGSTFSAYTSPDGVTWTLIPGSTATVSLPASVLAGLAVTSHNTTTTSTVTMNSITVG